MNFVRVYWRGEDPEVRSSDVSLSGDLESAVGNGQAVLPLKDLNPEVDGNGVVDEWEREVHDSIMAAAKTVDGAITRSELYGVIHSLYDKAKAMPVDTAPSLPGKSSTPSFLRGESAVPPATLERKSSSGVKSSTGIDISQLDPDTDGDGQIEDWEKDVFERIKAADADGSGSISVKELFGMIKQAADEVKAAQESGIPISSLNPDTDGTRAARSKSRMSDSPKRFVARLPMTGLLVAAPCDVQATETLSLGSLTSSSAFKPPTRISRARST